MRNGLLPAIALASLSFVSPAFGQCPANPLSALSGAWTFNIQSTQVVGGRELMVAGRFVASVGVDRANNPIGVLAINATSVFDQSTARLENDAGRYQINENCTGGTLTMNLSSFPMQYDFVFTNGGRSINIISTLAGRAATGSATLAPTGCPAGASLLSLLSGPYAFHLRSEPTAASNFSNRYAIAGRFVASAGVDRANNPIGLLEILATSNLESGREDSVTRLERDAGRYQINDDCSGGTLTFNLSSRPQQFQFYFRAGFEELDIVSTSNRPIAGVASRAPAAGCPANQFSLLTSNGGAWTFNIQSIVKTLVQNHWTMAGRWVATTVVDRGGNTIGNLALNASSINTNPAGQISPTRLESDAGRFQIFDDCTGGTLTMNLSSFPMQYDFWFYNNGNSMYIVSTSQGRGATGSAHVGVAGCPVGVTEPLTLVNGLYSAKIQRVPGFTLESYGLVGLVAAQIARDRAGNNFGQLGILATSSLGQEGTITRLETDAGKYQVNSDCTSGSLIFNLSSRPVQYNFYFRNGFQTLDVISDTGPAAYGVLTRY